MFTSGGTEAVHLGVLGLGEALPAAAVWCDPGAHPCLRAACEALAAARGVPFAWAPLVRAGDGAIDVAALADGLAPGALLAVSLVQHETGAALDWAPLRDAARARGATACHVTVAGVEGQELVAALDLEGVEVSSGAACSSGRAEPSESLLRLYPGEAWRAAGALRVTLGPETDDAATERACAVLPAVIGRVRG